MPLLQMEWSLQGNWQSHKRSPSSWTLKALKISDGHHVGESYINRVSCVIQARLEVVVGQE